MPMPIMNEQGLPVMPAMAVFGADGVNWARIFRSLDTSMLCTRIAGMPPERFTSVDDCIARMNSNYREDHNGMGATG